MEKISKELIMKASGGDITAFEEIYRISSSYVYNIAYRITGNKEDAQESTQEIFIKLYRSLKKFKFRSSFKVWLYRITVNTSINVYNKKIKYLRRRANYNDEIPGEDRNKTDDNEERVLSMLDILNPEQKTCIVLRNIEGLSYQEIADTLNININTVRSRLKRARDKLKEVLQNEMQEI